MRIWNNNLITASNKHGWLYLGREHDGVLRLRMKTRTRKYFMDFPVDEGPVAELWREVLANGANNAMVKA